MTSINKLGINPKSQYDTPLGIYSYPYTKDYKQRLLTDGLPFAGNKQFIQFFKVVRGPVLVLNSYHEGQYVSDREKLYKFVMGFGNKVSFLPPYNKRILTDEQQDKFIKLSIEKLKQKFSGLDRQARILERIFKQFFSFGAERGAISLYVFVNKIFTVLRELNEYSDIQHSDIEKVAKPVYEEVMDAIFDESENSPQEIRIKRFFLSCEKQAKLPSPAGKLWNVTRNIGMLISKERKTALGNISSDEDLSPEHLSPRAMVSWTYVLKTVLGYVGAVDMGLGLIHSNEPIQAVWFSKDVCQVIDTVLNLFHKPDTTGYEPSDEQKKATQKQMFMQQIRDWYETNIRPHFGQISFENILKGISFYYDKELSYGKEHLPWIDSFIANLKPSALSIPAAQSVFNSKLRSRGNNLFSFLGGSTALEKLKKFVPYLSYQGVRLNPFSGELDLRELRELYCSRQYETFFNVLYKPCLEQLEKEMTRLLQQDDYVDHLFYSVMNVKFMETTPEFLGDYNTMFVPQYKQAMEESFVFVANKIAKKFASFPEIKQEKLEQLKQAYMKTDEYLS